MTQEAKTELQKSFEADLTALKGNEIADAQQLAATLDDYAGSWDDLDSIAEGSIAELGKLEKKFATLRSQYGLDTTNRDGIVSVKTAVTAFEKAAETYKSNAESISDKRDGDEIIADFVKNISKVKNEALVALKADFEKNVTGKDKEKNDVIEKVEGSIDADKQDALEKQSD